MDEIIVLLEVTSDNLKPEFFNNQRNQYAQGSRDLLLVTMRKDGTILEGFDLHLVAQMARQSCKDKYNMELKHILMIFKVGFKESLISILLGSNCKAR